MLEKKTLLFGLVDLAYLDLHDYDQLDLVLKIWGGGVRKPFKVYVHIQELHM